MVSARDAIATIFIRVTSKQILHQIVWTEIYATWCL